MALGGTYGVGGGGTGAVLAPNNQDQQSSDPGFDAFWGAASSAGQNQQPPQPPAFGVGGGGQSAVTAPINPPPQPTTPAFGVGGGGQSAVTAPLNPSPQQQGGGSNAGVPSPTPPQTQPSQPTAQPAPPQSDQSQIIQQLQQQLQQLQQQFQQQLDQFRHWQPPRPQPPWQQGQGYGGWYTDPNTGQQKYDPNLNARVYLTGPEAQGYWGNYPGVAFPGGNPNHHYDPVFNGQQQSPPANQSQSSPMSYGPPPWAASLNQGYARPAFMGQGYNPFPNQIQWGGMLPSEREAAMQTAQMITGMSPQDYLQNLGNSFFNFGPAAQARYQAY